MRATTKASLWHSPFAVVLAVATSVPLAFVACNGSDTSNVGAPAPEPTPAEEAGSDTGELVDAGPDALNPTEGIPAPAACPTAKFKTLVIVGDSISDIGGGTGVTREGPFYRTLLVKNDDAKYPAWKGFDLSTCWGLDPATHVVKASLGGAVASVPSPNNPTDKGILLNQVTGLPAALEGPVLVVGTIGGNDVQSGLVSLLLGAQAEVDAKVVAFAAGVDAALTELTKPDRFGAGVKATVVLTSVYDPSGGTGRFYYEPAAVSCPGALGYWPDNKETKSALAPWNAALAAEIMKHPSVKLLDIATPFALHPVATPAGTNWFYKDCIHPSSLGHHALRGIIWEGLRSLP